MTGEKNSGMAIASLVLGICSVILFWVPVLDIILSVLAVVLGFVSLNEIKKKKLEGRGMAIAGIITGFVGMFLFIVFVILWAVIVSMMHTSITNFNVTQNITSNLSQVGGY